MAKLIKDPDKLIRRSIAVVMRWGTNDHIGYDVGVPKKRMLGRHFVIVYMKWDSLGRKFVSLLSTLKTLTANLVLSAVLALLLDTVQFEESVLTISYAFGIISSINNN